MSDIENEGLDQSGTAESGDVAPQGGKDENASPDALPEGPEGSEDNLVNKPEGNEPEGDDSATDVRKQLSGEDSVEFKVPDEFSEKSWAKDIKSEEDLYKLIDSMAGEVPESADGYEFPEIEGFGDNDYEAARALAHVAGLNKDQANKLLEAYSENLQKENAQLYDKDSMVETLKSEFGKNYQERVESISKNIKNFGTEEDLSRLMDLPNNHLLSVMKIVDSITRSYGVESSDLVGEQGSDKAKVMTEEERSAEWKKYYESLKNLDSRPHSAQERQEILDKLNKL